MIELPIVEDSFFSQSIIREALSSVNEATITSGKNPIGTVLMLGFGKKSTEFAKRVKKLTGETIKGGDKLKLVSVSEVDPFTSISFESKGSAYYFVRNEKTGTVYELKGSDSAHGYLNSIFSYVKGRGKGGVKFEKQLSVDLISFMSSPEGEYPKGLLHEDVIIKLDKHFLKKGIDLRSFAFNSFNVEDAGKQNSKRTAKFDGSKIIVTNSNGETLTDLTLNTPEGKFFMSLKFSSGIYLMNVSLKDPLEQEHTRKALYDYFGLDGQAMGGFGDQYLSNNKGRSEGSVKKSLEALLTDGFGGGYIYVHKFGKGDVAVADINYDVKVKISSGLEFIYPEEGKRKYAAVKFDAKLMGHTFKVSFQFRGTTEGALTPRYLRVHLLKR